MKHVNLDQQSESVKAFVLNVAASSTEALLELNGQVLARMIPTAARNEHSAEQGRVFTAFHEARQAFLRDLPVLLANPRIEDSWAAYHAGRQVGIRRSPQELLREIHRQGIPARDCFIGVIRPHEAAEEEMEPRHGHHYIEDEPIP
jgi:hypothetical protein